MAQVKASLKKCGEDDASLRRVLHSRQLGLKLISNVTYGYTSANFSGRMPCSEVRKGRRKVNVCGVGQKMAKKGKQKQRKGNKKQK